MWCSDTMNRLSNYDKYCIKMQVQRFYSKHFSCKMTLAIRLNVVNITRESDNSDVEYRRLLVLIFGSNDEHFQS